MFYDPRDPNVPPETEKKELIPMTDWDKAPVTDLIDTKNELYNRFCFAAQKNMDSVKQQLQGMLVKLDAIIQKRMSS